jgi:hypothetical protein
LVQEAARGTSGVARRAADAEAQRDTLADALREKIE